MDNSSRYAADRKLQARHDELTHQNYSRNLQDVLPKGQKMVSLPVGNQWILVSLTNDTTLEDIVTILYNTKANWRG